MDAVAAYFQEPWEVVPEAHERMLCVRNRSYFKSSAVLATAFARSSAVSRSSVSGRIRRAGMSSQ
jgi:hypothetical protein